ncbi:glycoside hydrolase family 43 protein [Desertivirga xinjiangensis]|uniref:glycoside hydrolase family 43 protein n=1 Tax=Desertivirga xinjiangensis TaxID=539206 RepID=UPI00210C0417|nr:glycoside hydrolase family 43 protein [Pedobacter xinjiangensis]
MKIKISLNIAIIFFLFGSLLALGCEKKSDNPALGPDAGMNPEPDETENPAAVNPVFQADPTIFYHEGTYYLYGTNDKNANNGFLVYTSTDMKQWTPRGYALQKGEAFGDWGFWAPHVWADNGKFYMAYTANEKIAIAESSKPNGPFRQQVKAALVSSYGLIDPFIFINDDGKKYLYHVRLGGGNRIWVAEMEADYSAMKTGTNTECITATPGTWEHVNTAAGRVAEGPTVIKDQGLYYLFYSANDFRHKDYAVGYAVSENVNGPWTRYTGNPIIHQSVTGHAGSGHGDIVKGKDGNLSYVFHTHNTSATVTPRKTAIINLKKTKDASQKDVFDVEAGSFSFLNSAY